MVIGVKVIFLFCCKSEISNIRPSKTKKNGKPEMPSNDSTLGKF